MTVRCKPLPVVDPKRCVACGRCVDACILGLRRIVNNVSILADSAPCLGEGLCVEPCATGAIRIERNALPPPAP